MYEGSGQCAGHTPRYQLSKRAKLLDITNIGAQLSNSLKGQEVGLVPTHIFGCNFLCFYANGYFGKTSSTETNVKFALRMHHAWYIMHVLTKKCRYEWGLSDSTHNSNNF